jgi:predicted flavoprotein YhiN
MDTMPEHEAAPAQNSQVTQNSQTALEYVLQKALPSSQIDQLFSGSSINNWHLKQMLEKSFPM